MEALAAFRASCSRRRREAVYLEKREDTVLDPDECWDSILRRDKTRDGHFYFGVLTTGVYCRPSCPARKPLRQNVRFYETTEQAENAGLRACLRCRPLDAATADARVAAIGSLCEYIEENVERTLTLAELAGRAQLSASYLQRLFKSVVGVSPKQYADACRMRKLKSELRVSKDVAQAVYGAGFGSSSRVYERADAQLGMTPGEYRRGAPGVVITYAPIESAFGLLLLGATDRGICFLQFGETREGLLAELQGEYPAASLEPMRHPPAPEFDRWVKAINGHLEGKEPRLKLPLDVRATAFQRRVWTYLQSIPRGQVQSYGKVAAGIGQPGAARAVGRACATNRVAVIIPCHRVIRGGGELGEYRWGLKRKQALLEAERARTAVPA
jgi:AraC family transcriptional regulator, regulatory protein of adaptative response / methylated-DNA-[protein]-cysteine methyltransferase